MKITYAGDYVEDTSSASLHETTIVNHFLYRLNTLEKQEVKLPMNWQDSDQSPFSLVRNPSVELLRSAREVISGTLPLISEILFRSEPRPELASAVIN